MYFFRTRSHLSQLARGSPAGRDKGAGGTAVRGADAPLPSRQDSLQAGSPNQAPPSHDPPSSVLSNLHRMASIRNEPHSTRQTACNQSPFLFLL